MISKVICPFLYILISYLITGQPMDMDRFWLSAIPLVLSTLVSQSQGLLVGAIFMKDIVSAVFLAPSTSVPLMLFSGFFIKIDQIPDYFQWGVIISYVRYAFGNCIIIASSGNCVISFVVLLFFFCTESCVMAIYGFGRCGDDTVGKVATINQRLSLFLSNIFRIALSGECEKYVKKRP